MATRGNVGIINTDNTVSGFVSSHGSNIGSLGDFLYENIKSVNDFLTLYNNIRIHDETNKQSYYKIDGLDFGYAENFSSIYAFAEDGGVFNKYSYLFDPKNNDWFVKCASTDWEYSSLSKIIERRKATASKEHVFQ